MREARAAEVAPLATLQEEQRTRRAALAAAQQEARERRAQAMEEHQSALREQAQARIERAFGRFIERANAAIARLSTLTDRLESRVRIVEESTGERLVVARESIDEARRLLFQAGEDVEVARMVLRDVLASDQPRERFHEVRDALAIARESLRETHLVLRGAVASVQAALSDE